MLPDRALRDLIDDLNAQLVALERRARVRTVTEEDRGRLAAAHRALEAVARAYIDADGDERRTIEERAGFDPTLRLSFVDFVRRHLTWFPKRRGDYRDALWAAALTYADEERATTREGLRLALAVLCIEGGRQDPRDTANALMRLQRAATAAGIDHTAAFREARTWAGEASMMARLLSP